MAKKKFAIGAEHGFIGQTKMKFKPRPINVDFSEYIELRNRCLDLKQQGYTNEQIKKMLGL